MPLFKFYNPGTLDLASQLNASQLEAATYQDGPLLIVAGAGSGKTRTLVHRVAFLIDQGIHPSSILLLTFTRKAASEMLGRCAVLVGEKARQVSGGTFHSLANLILRQYSYLVDYPANFGILDQDDAEKMLSNLRAEMPEIKKYKRFPQKGALLNIISQSINKDKSILDVLADDFPYYLEYAPLIETLSLQYKVCKRQNISMDFDDLLVMLQKILRENESARQIIASKYQYILVDEYQDTNPIQANLAYHLAKDHCNITAVGDDAQSIYAFRGASFRNIMDFPKIFLNAKILKLEENYRSKTPIITVANHLISQASERYDKNLKAIRGSGSEVEIIGVMDTKDEAIWIVNEIEKLLAKGVGLNEIAILFRSASHSFDLEVELTSKKIPFIKYGGRKFLESAHIKDFLAFLKVAANPADSLSLRRILSLVEGIGSKTAQTIIDWVEGKREKLLLLADAPISERLKSKATVLFEMIEKIAQSGEQLNFRLNIVCDFYYPLIKDLYPDDWFERQEDIKEMLRIAEEQTSLRAFLDSVTLDPPNQFSVGEKETRNSLILSTIHSAKGLEWKVVFVLSAVEGRFPSPYALKSKDDIEEERRLMYVAITRAEDILYIMMPLGIVDRNTGLIAKPSRFLANLPHEDGVCLFKNGQDKKYRDLVELADPFDDSNFGFNRFKSYEKKTFEKESNLKNNSFSDEKVVEVMPGQRVTHPIYGSGVVVESLGASTVIEFDYFGRKAVTTKYAKLKVIS